MSLYGQTIDELVPVSSSRVAESAKPFLWFCRILPHCDRRRAFIRIRACREFQFTIYRIDAFRVLDTLAHDAHVVDSRLCFCSYGNSPQGRVVAIRSFVVRCYGTIRDRCFINPSDLRRVSFNSAQRQRKRNSIRVCAVLRSASVEGVTVAYTDRQAHKALWPGPHAGLESC